MLTDFLPFLAAFDTLVKIGHALLHVAAEHVFLVDLSLASADDLVGDLGHEAAHTLVGVVVVAELEDHAHAVKHLGQLLWDVSRLTVLNFPAGFLQDHEELQTVISYFEFFRDACCQLLETSMIRTLRLLEHLDYPLQFGLFQPILEHAQVSVACRPMLDLVEG